MDMGMAYSMAVRINCQHWLGENSTIIVTRQLGELEDAWEAEARARIE